MRRCWTMSHLNWPFYPPCPAALLLMQCTPDHLILDNAPNLGPLISRWEINKFENCWYKSVSILEVLKHLFQRVLNFPSSQWGSSGPILGDLSNNRWSGGNFRTGNSLLVDQPCFLIFIENLCLCRSRSDRPWKSRPFFDHSFPSRFCDFLSHPFRKREDATLFPCTM
jgi:hypothetical protein